MSVVSLAGVRKRYGPTVALDGVSLSVERGEMFGLMGPDGAGKTTMIRLACGLIHADGGAITVLGRDPVRQHRAVTRSIGYLSQRFSLYGDLSVDENLAFFAEIHGVARYQAERERLLALTRLAAFRSRLADRLSGGMKQKLALACTLIHRPEILLLDEPTTGVDPVSRRELWMLLSEFLAEGITVVMATPYLDEAERCSRVALLHQGRLLAVDRPGRLREAFGGVLVEVIASPAWEAFDRLRALDGVADVQAFGDRAHVRLEGPLVGGALDAMAARLRETGLTVASVRPVHPSLEDVFIDRVTGGTGPGIPPEEAT